MAHREDRFSNRPKDHIAAARNATTASPEELHEELLKGAPGSDYDRSLTREDDFGGGFGQGHYTGTSWDPKAQESKDAQDTDEDLRAPRTHPENLSGSAGAGKFGGVPSIGLTTGGGSRHSS